MYVAVISKFIEAYITLYSSSVHITDTYLKDINHISFNNQCSEQTINNRIHYSPARHLLMNNISGESIYSTYSIQFDHSTHLDFLCSMKHGIDNIWAITIPHFPLNISDGDSHYHCPITYHIPKSLLIPKNLEISAL